MKKLIFIIGFIILSFRLFSQEVPKFDGPSWRIASHAPDVAPYNLSGLNTCDFTIYQSTDGKWHCVACIRYTSYPGRTRLFHRWEADSLTQKDWVAKGIFWTAGTKGAPDTFGRQLGVNTPYTLEGALQAPHVFKHEGKYYMFHNNEGAFCLISDDGRNWTQWADYKNNPRFFYMSRDVMIFNDLDASGKWYGCFLQNLPGPGNRAYMGARTADSLKGPWSSSIVKVHGEGNPESPFMLKRGNYYYLWEQLIVFANDKPFGFNEDAIVKMGGGASNAMWAPEIIQYNGEYYIAGYNSGIHIRKIKWVPKADPSLDAYAKNISLAEATFYPKFDSLQTHYYVTVPNSVTNLTFTNTLSKKTLSVVNFQAANLPVGEREVRVAVTSSDKLTSRIYYFHVHRLSATAPAYSLTVNNGHQSGTYTSGQRVTLIAQVPEGKVFDKWVGDIAGVEDISKSKTVLVMPPAATYITATYKTILNTWNSEEESEITVSPNPVKNVLNVSGIAKQSNISICNINGELMTQLNATDLTMNIDTDCFPSGLYVVKIRNNEKTTVKKFIKE